MDGWAIAGKGNAVFSSRTTLVVGAGASADFDFPTGYRLIPEIQEAIAFRFESGKLAGGEPRIYNAIRKRIEERGGTQVEVNRAASIIRENLDFARSIDNCIHINRSDEDVVLLGKLAILSKIADREASSGLAVKQIDARQFSNIHQVKNSWLHRFMQVLHTDVTLSEFSEAASEVQIVCFNYDRCIEHFLTVALQRVYNCDLVTAVELSSKIKIVHPYGRIGRLPLERTNEDPLAFGERLPHDSEKLLRLATNLKTFTERKVDSTTMNDLSYAIQRAETIIFLGFGFHGINMELIGLDEEQEQCAFAKRIIATTMGMSEPIRLDVANMLSKFTLSEESVFLHNGNCANLFDAYDRVICR